MTWHYAVKENSVLLINVMHLSRITVLLMNETESRSHSSLSNGNGTHLLLLLKWGLPSGVYLDRRSGVEATEGERDK